MALLNKVAIVTGGTKGIGRAVALRLVKEGASVVVSYSSDSSAAASLEKEIGDSKRFLAVKSDAGSVTDNQALVDAAVQKFSKIDILIPNAGMLLMKTLADTSEDDFDKIYALNVKGPYFLAQKAAPHMPPGGHIIFVSTTQCIASTVTPNYLLYCSTKGAIEQMTRIISKDLSAKEISVNCISPGPVATELFLKGKPDALVKQIASFSPRNRLAQPEEIANAVAFLSSPDSAWVSGQILRANGGSA